MEVPIDKEDQSVVQSLRRTPFNLRERLEQKIDELEQFDVIEKATGPKPSISPVVVPEQSDIRLCIDMRQANSAIVMERHPILDRRESYSVLKKVFSKLYIKWAFHQIQET